MDTETFVSAIKCHVCEPAIRDILFKLSKPPGRNPPADKTARSDWYNDLTEREAEYVAQIVAMAVHDAVFGLFAVLDGSRVIEKGRFELTHVNGKRVLLNDPDRIGLNEVFNANN